MSIAAGTRLGPYEILGLIGARGMGEVYKGRNTRRKLDVALKVLPMAVATDRDRLGRFQREAKLRVVVNHPCIAQIHGSNKRPTILRSSWSWSMAKTRQGGLPAGPSLSTKRFRSRAHDGVAGAVLGQVSGSCEFNHQFNGDHLGFSSAVHDVNGDGKVNILANARSGDSGGRLDTGFVRLYRDF